MFPATEVVIVFCTDPPHVKHRPQGVDAASKRSVELGCEGTKVRGRVRARCCVLYIGLLKRQLILLCGCSVRVVYDMTPLQRLHGRWDAWGLLVEQEDSVRVNT